MTQDIKTVRVHVPYEVSRVSEYIRTQKLLRKYRKEIEGIDLARPKWMSTDEMKEIIAERIMSMDSKELDLFEPAMEKGIYVFLDLTKEAKGKLLKNA